MLNPNKLISAWRKLRHRRKGTPKNCPWVTHFGLAVFCDGRVSCNCGDGFTERIIGDLAHESLTEIWRGKRISKLRDGLRRGILDDFCVGCQFLEDKPLEMVHETPEVLFLEPTVSCNLRCPQHVCIELNDHPLQYRRSIRWNLDDFVQKIVLELKHYKEFRFFINGEGFLNKDLPAMLTAAREANPSIYMLTSTNGNVMSEAMIKSLVENRIDYVSFSIDGGYQESYERYRVKGSLEGVLKNVDRLIRFKQEMKSDKPIIHWRYILFHWNDSWDEMKHAVHMAKAHGFDEFSWHLTTEPEGFPSRKFILGTPEYAHIEADIFREPYPGTSNALKHIDRYE